MTEEQIQAVQWDKYRDSPLFTGAERAAIAWAHHLTERTFRQHPEAFRDMRAHYTDAQIVEATLVSGYFNMWNRFTDSLQIDIEGEDQMQLFTKSVAIDPEDWRAYMRGCWWAEGRDGRGG